MSGGLSIGGNAPKRKIGSEFPQIQEMLRTEETALNNFTGGQPLLAGAEGLGLGFAGGLPSLTNPLMSLMGSLPSAIGGIGAGLGGLFNETGGLFNSVGNLASRIPNFSALERPVMQGFRNTTAPVLRSGGRLTPEQERDVSTATGNLFASRGTEGGNQAIGQQLLDRQQFQEQRFNEALGQAGSASNIIGGLTQEDIGLRSGIMGQQGQLIGEGAGLLGQGSGLLSELTGMESGLAGGVQGLESGSINQLLAPEQAAVGSFTSLMNPLLSYASNLFAGNQAAQLQQGLANQNKASGLVGGGTSAITSILPMLIGLSDKRLKTAIRHTGESTPEGIPIKTFQFKGDKRGQRFMGVIAQDVAKRAPHAVGMGPDGLLRVNFSAIHAPYHRLGRPMRGGPMGTSGRQQVEGAGPTLRGPDLGENPLPPIMVGGPSSHVPDLPGSTDAESHPGGRMWQENFGGDSPIGGLDPFTGTAPAWGNPAFGNTILPTQWVNYPGVGLVPMAVPVGPEDDSNIGSGYHST